jgi:hypothetical protein
VGLEITEISRLRPPRAGRVSPVEPGRASFWLSTATISGFSMKKEICRTQVGCQRNPTGEGSRRNLFTHGRLRLPCPNLLAFPMSRDRWRPFVSIKPKITNLQISVQYQSPPSTSTTSTASIPSCLLSQDTDSSPTPLLRPPVVISCGRCPYRPPATHRCHREHANHRPGVGCHCRLSTNLKMQTLHQ